MAPQSCHLARTPLPPVVDTASGSTSAQWALPGHTQAASACHPPGRDKLQQPVGPDLLDAAMGNGAHVGQVELLVPAEVVLVSPAVWQWGAGDRRRMWGHQYLWGAPTEQPHPTPCTFGARA